MNYSRETADEMANLQDEKSTRRPSGILTARWTLADGSAALPA